MQEPPCVHIRAQPVWKVMAHSPALLQQDPAWRQGVGAHGTPTRNGPGQAAPLEMVQRPAVSQHAPVSETETVTVVGAAEGVILVESDGCQTPLAVDSEVNDWAVIDRRSKRIVREERLVAV